MDARPALEPTMTILNHVWRTFVLAAVSTSVALAQQPSGSASAPPATETYQQQMAREQAEHPTLKIGAAAPSFSLPGIDGKTHTLDEYKASPILAVAFISNHCPSSQLYEGRLKQIVQDYASKGVTLIAVAPNGPQAVSPRELNYTDLDDSFEAMRLHAEHRRFNFPYLYDGETQAVSHAYGPKVTPHLFIFDKDRKLQYEGRIDDHQPATNIKSHDARNALDAMLAGRPVPVSHTPVFGCSTKWNSQIAGKQREMKDWLSQPVTVSEASVADITALRANTGEKAKTTMIAFWSPECVPCRQQFEDLLTTHLWYRSRDFELVTVAVARRDARTAVSRFLEEKHSALRNLMIDPADLPAVQKAFGATWDPPTLYTTVILPGGSQLYRHEGANQILTLKRTILAKLPEAANWRGNAAYWAE